MLACGCVALYSLTWAARAASYQTTSGGDDALVDADLTLADEPPAVTATTATTATLSASARNLGLKYDFIPRVLLSWDTYAVAARSSWTKSGSAMPGSLGAWTSPSGPTLVSRVAGLDVTSDS